MRLFVAIELDPALRRALGDVQNDSPLDGKGVRFVRSELLHLTLRFLGEVEETRISAVTAAVQTATSTVPSFDFEVRGLGCFPGPERPRVLWAGLGSVPLLVDLAEKVEAAIRAEGFPPEDRPFSPHITLARVKRSGVKLGRPLDSRQPVFGTQTVQQVTVVKSTLQPQGPEYQALFQSRLGGTLPG